MFSKILRFGSSDDNQNTNVTLRIVGDRGVGKTTYIAALARWPIVDQNSPVKEITHTNSDGKKLYDDAKTILEEGKQFLPTPRIDQYPNYGLKIVFKEKFSWKKSPLEIDLYCKDYSGEFFSDILFDKNAQDELNTYIEDCSKSGTDILLLLDSISYRKDETYEDMIQQFLDQLNDAEWQGKMAVALTKCEQPEVWGKIKSESIDQLILKWFPKVFNKLEARQSLCQVEYFALSAFGMVGTVTKRPNTKYSDQTKTEMVLDNPRLWKPFGLVSPLYWLCTGKRHPNQWL